jgi:hypothetical protein
MTQDDTLVGLRNRKSEVRILPGAPQKAKESSELRGETGERLDGGKPAATQAATFSPAACPPLLHQLRIAGAVLDELARAHSTAWSDPATREALATVAAWLGRLATPGRHAELAQSERCECGAALAHVFGVGVVAVLCPRCDGEG